MYDKVEEKISKALKYVEEPNELDLGMDALKDMVTSQQRELDELRKMIKQIEGYRGMSDETKERRIKLIRDQEGRLMSLFIKRADRLLT